MSGCRRRANAHRQSVRQTATKEAVRLKSMVPPKQETLLSTASEKGVSTWLTADPLTSHGTVLNKSDFRDAVCLRYGYELDGLSSRCVCGKEMSHDHALSCPTGGYPSARHNEIFWRTPYRALHTMWKLSQYSFHSRVKTFQGEQRTGQLQLDLTFVPGASGHASRMPFLMSG